MISPTGSLAVQPPDALATILFVRKLGLQPGDFSCVISQLRSGILALQRGEDVKPCRSDTERELDSVFEVDASVAVEV
jgi:hypothetical protein